MKTNVTLEQALDVNEDSTISDSENGDNPVDSNTDDLIERIENGDISLAVITAPYDQVLLNGFMVGTDNIVAFINSCNASEFVRSFNLM